MESAHNQELLQYAVPQTKLIDVVVQQDTWDIEDIRGIEEVQVQQDV